MRSIRLVSVLACLFISAPLGGASSLNGNGNNQRDQLRGRARAVEGIIRKNSEGNDDSRNSHFSKDDTSPKDNAKIDEKKRELQKIGDDYAEFMVWEDDRGFDGGGYDDYFAIPEAVAYTGNTADDNYFYSQPTVVDVVTGTGSQPNNQYYDDDYNYVGQDDGEDDYFKTNARGGALKKPYYNHYYYGKGAKSAKSKYSKKYKDYHYGSKSGKYSKTYYNAYYGKHKNKQKHKVVKAAAVGYRYDVPDYDDYTGMDDIFHFTQVDEQYETSTGTWSTGHDDYFESYSNPNTRSYQGSNSYNSRETGNQGRSSTTSGNTGSAASASSQYYDDDDGFFTVDEVVYFLPRPMVIIDGSVYSENLVKAGVSPPVTPDNTDNSLTLGTEYVWDETLSNALNINSNLIPIQVDDEIINFFFRIDGYCVRIGPPNENSVQGYCFFTYTAIDPRTNIVSGSFTAQGIIVNAQTPGQLTVSGGTGLLTGATGLVEILPAELDEQVFPPMLIQPQPNEDPFDDVAGWAHYFQIYVDVFFFLPQLYAPPR